MPLSEPTLEAATLSESKRQLLAQRLKGTRAAQSAGAPALDRIPPRDPSVPTLIGPDQYGIWLDATLQPDVPTYNDPITVRYRGPMDPAHLELALNAFVARHEAWRTSYLVENGEVVQHVLPELLITLPLVDLTHLQLADREAESLRLATRQAIQPIDPAHAPLFRVLLVRIAEDDHRLHLLLHHLIFDGLSLRRIFLPELITLYNAFAAGTQPNLPPLALQYPDYSAWRRQQADSPAMDVHLDFWRQQLAGDIAVLRLPTDRPRPAVISHRGNTFRFDLSRDLIAHLRETGKQHGATLYMTLLATLKVLLFRYSAQEDVIVGSVAAARRRPELESMMGYITDVFAVRTAPNADLPFSAYLKQVRHAVLGSLGASEIPFDRVVSALSAQQNSARRDLSHNPVFQTVFAFQPSAEELPAGWQLGKTPISNGATKFDLHIEADEQLTHTEVSLSYSTDLFEPETIHRLANHWRTLIEAVIEVPETPLGDLNLLTPAERHQLLVGWNDRDTPIPDQTMHGLVEAQVAITPNAPAVTFEAETLTYAQLDREATRLAHHLRLAGSAPGTLAAVFLDRSQYLVAGLLGILKSGAAYLPLDPGTPAARIALCLEDAAPAVILTQRSRLATLPPSAATIVVLEDVLAAPFCASFIPSEPDPDALAYVIHTSGSTGRPKGVELRHRGVVNLLLSMQREPGFTAADTLVALTTVSFDIAVLELFLPLITGGRVVVASRETALDPERLAALLESSHATVLQATPATWSALLASGWQPHKTLKALCGGEALNRSLADRLQALRLDLWNVYGPTETTIWSTAVRVTPGSGPIAIGRPIANTSAYILDSRLNPVPIGVPGELFLGGVGLARGYRNKPELTAEKFIPNPFPTDNGQRSTDNRIYRTGDHALYRADGTLEVQGRADNQVKIRGFRIELEDVEVNLTAHPEVAFAAARAWPDPENGGHRLCAYLVGVAGPPPSASEMRQFLRGRVADYMIPSDIVALPSMPLTSNGKIDRKQLLPPERTASTGTAIAINSPLTGDQLRLAAIWSRLLNVDTISATDNFFDLGGHSLMLLKLIRMIDKEFDIALPMTSLFQAPTIEKLALVVHKLAHPEEAQPGTAPAYSETVVPLNPHGDRVPLFLIHSLLLYGRMPAALGADQPFYGLQTYPFDNFQGDNWVEVMLEDHIAQIKRIQPHGPYQLAGWCFAGLIAYEVARRLEAQGDTVSLLALLDSWNPSVVSRNQPPAAVLKACPENHAISAAGETCPVPTPTPVAAAAKHSFLARLRSLLWKVNFRTRQFIRLSPGERGGHVRRMFRDLFKKIAIPVERQSKSALYRLCLRFNLPKPAFLHDPMVVTYEWVRSYKLQPFHGDIDLLRPADIAIPPDSDPCCGWRRFTSGNIHTTFIPGDRSTMFLGPNLEILATELRQMMDDGIAKAAAAQPKELAS